LKDFSKRIPELDGIRGLAIFLVIICHWIGLEGGSVLPSKVQGLLIGGWSGVDLFFVLSGFLIGGILLDAKDSSNYFKVFYIRRFYRILPLYGALCFWSVAVFYAHVGTHDWLFQEKIPWYAYLTFGQNFWMAKFNAMSSRQIDVTWSLAVEEQFYLTLPLIIRFTSRKSLPSLLGIGVLLAPLIRVAVWFSLAPAYRDTATFTLAPCRMDALLLGVLAACAVRSAAWWSWLLAHRTTIRGASVILGIGVLEMLHQKMGRNTLALASFGYTVIALFYVTLLLLAVTESGLVSRLFRSRPLTRLGILAYGLYLFHQPVLGLVYSLAGRTSPQLVGFSTAGLTLLSGFLVFTLARLSWLYFEKPLVNRGHRYHYLYVGNQEPSAPSLQLAVNS
jgi:peptidoglycan/LPS O-acetylase OafA/YrhL